MKQYILKPGKHQFAPGSAAVHSNDNLTDEEAEWYLQQYPHIASLFENPEGGELDSPKDEKPGAKIKRKRIPPKSMESSKSV